MQYSQIWVQIFYVESVRHSYSEHLELSRAIKNLLSNHQHKNTANMEVLRTPPSASSFTPLSEHQSQTPQSFYSGPAILYHHSPSATLKIHARDLDSAPALSGFANGAHRNTNGHATAPVTVNGDATPEEEQDEEVELANMDVWVTSEYEHPARQ